MVITSMKLPPELLDQARNQAASQGVTASELYRQAIAAYLRRHRKRQL